MQRSVTKELNFAESLLSSVEVHSPRFAADLDPELSGNLGEGRSVSILDLTDSLSVRTRRDMDGLEGAERNLLDHRRVLFQFRETRDTDRDALYRGLLVFRSAFDAAYGPRRSEVLLGLEPGMGDVEPGVLLRFSNTALAVVAKPEFEVPPTGLAGAEVKTTEAAEDIRPLSEALRASLRAVRLEERRTQESQRLRDQALERLHTTSQSLAKVAEALFALNGEEFHAERLRPTSRGRSSANSETPDDDGSLPADEPPDKPNGAVDEPSPADPAEQETPETPE